jgi:short-subunit dehydrogenase
MILNIFCRSTLRETRNLVVRPPARPGVLMTNGPRRVVLITGASSGIGRVTAELLAVRNYRVFGGVRSAVMRRQGAGLIVNISSILGFLPAPFMGVYASTKHL